MDTCNWTPTPFACQSRALGSVFLLPFAKQAPVVQKVDNAIHRINHYPLDIAIGFAIIYPVDSAIHPKLGPDDNFDFFTQEKVFKDFLSSNFVLDTIN